jgi:SulP family sulfate permease
MEHLKPMLLTTLKGYSKEQFVKDVIAGIIVAIIALPLSIALALASGVGPEKGIYTSIVAGFIIAALGGSRVQISGPTAAFATIVASIVARNGIDGLIMATLMAGVFLILMGLFRFGSLIRFIPYTITTGFTAGIAVTILIGQFKDFFGVTYMNGEAPVETMEKLGAFIGNLGTLNWQALLIGLFSLAILIIFPKINDKIPPSLIAVIAGSILVKVLSLDVNTIGDLYTITNTPPTFHMPQLSLDLAKTVYKDAFTIAILAAIESLLSCVVADSMTNTKHRSNMELIAQGFGNLGSALFGGIPATGAIARTAANIKSGGKTPVSGMVHAVVLLLILVVFMPYAALIPMPVIAAILFMVAYNMCQWRPFVHLVRTASRSDVIVLILTFFLTVIFDLVTAIEVGVLLACILFMKRMSDETNVRSWKYMKDDEWDDSNKFTAVPRHIRVYEVSGPLFFGAAGSIAEINVKQFTKCLIIRMRSVPDLDATGLNALEELFERCSKRGIIVLFSHVNAQPMYIMKRAGFADKVGLDRFCPHIDDALELAKQLTGEGEQPPVKKHRIKPAAN